MPCRSRRVLLLATALMAAACGSTAPPPRFPDLHFTSEAPLRLAVAGIDVTDQFVPTFQPLHVEAEMPVPLARALGTLAHERLTAGAPGSHRYARVVITDATVIQTPPKQLNAAETLLGTESPFSYKGRAAITLEIIGDGGVIERTVSSQAEATEPVKPGGTLNDQDQAKYDLVRRLSGLIDEQTTQQIRAVFGNLLLS